MTKFQPIAVLSATPRTFLLPDEANTGLIWLIVGVERCLLDPRDLIHAVTSLVRQLEEAPEPPRGAA